MTIDFAELPKKDIEKQALLARVVRSHCLKKPKTESELLDILGVGKFNSLDEKHNHYLKMVRSAIALAVAIGFLQRDVLDVEGNEVIQFRSIEQAEQLPIPFDLFEISRLSDF